MKKVAGSLRLDLAAFRDLEAFAQLGTELDTATQRQLDRGQRMVELLKQPQYQPFNVNEEVLSIFAGTRGLLDDVPAKRRRRASRRRCSSTSATSIRRSSTSSTARRTCSNDLAEKIAKAIKDFKSQFNKTAAPKGAAVG